MQIIIALLFASALAWLTVNWKLFKHKFFGSRTFCGIFLVKLLFGISFYLVYTVYYNDRQTSDMHKYYNDAVKIFELTKEKPRSYLSILTGVEMNSNDEVITQQLSFWYQEESAAVINDSRMVIRFNLMMLSFSRGNIYLHLVMMVFLSFIGLYFIYLSFEKSFQEKEILLLIACFGIPSVMFWSSGIMKEGLLVFFFGMLIQSLFGKQKKYYSSILLFLISIGGMFFAKFYVALALLPSFLFLLLGVIFNKKSLLWHLAMTSILVIFSTFSFNTALNNLPLQKLSKKQNDFINLSIGGVYLVNTNYPKDTIFTLKQSSLTFTAPFIQGKTSKLKTGTIYHHWKNPGYADTLVASNNQNIYQVLKVLEPTGSAITLKRLMPNYISVIRLFPEAFINVCFRPFIGDVENAFSLLACIENILFILLVIIMIYFYRKPSATSQRIIIFSLLFVFTLYTLVGLTTPVLGAAVRYKVPALPFLLISIFLLSDYAKLKVQIKLWTRPLSKQFNKQ
jgi:hypothetical protein